MGSVIIEDKFRNVALESEQQVYREEKLGHFAYGDFTVLLMFEKGRMNAVTVQQGQRIGKLQEYKQGLFELLALARFRSRVVFLDFA